MLKNLTIKKLFLIDGFGAVVTAFMLGFVLSSFETLFGMPQNILFILAGIACCFAIYSFSCYFFIKENGKPFLKVIAIANTLYCILTLVLVIYLNQTLTWLGVAYFVGEIIIVLALVSVEWRYASK